jgi:hypothetical protein
VAGLFPDRGSVRAAQTLFRGAGYPPEHLLLLASVDDDVAPLCQRQECIFRSAVRWAIIGALALEIPVVAAILLMDVSPGIRIFLAASIWKVGGLIGAWIGLLAGQDHGLEPEVAQRYERHMARGRVVLAVRVPRRDLPGARGIMLESGALEARDVEGTFEPKGALVPLGLSVGR